MTTSSFSAETGAPRATTIATEDRSADHGADHRSDHEGPHVDAEPLDLADLLHALADDLVDAFDETSGGALVAGECTTEGIVLLTNPLDGVHPAEALTGFTAPDEWWCIGVLTTGTAHHLPADAPDATERLQVARRSAERSEPVTIVHLTDRLGRSVTVHRCAGSPPSIITGTTTGRIDDCCRRALGLPTAPPPSSTLPFHAGQWLHFVLQQALAGGLDGAGWPEVARLHPLLILAAEGGDDDLADWAVEHLPRAGEQFAAAADWHDLFAQARADACFQLSGLADWYDEGTYARTLLGGLPDPEAALATLDELLPGDIADRIRATLRAWDVAGPAYPG